MAKWFRFIRKGHLMMATIRAKLLAVNQAIEAMRADYRKAFEIHSQTVLGLDDRIDKMRQEWIALESRISAMEGFQLSILERLAALESRPALVPKPKPDDGVVKTRSMSEFTRVMRGDIDDATQGKVG